MEVGFTVYDKEGKTHQTIIEMPNDATIPQLGDDLIYDDLVCTIERRDFQVVSKRKGFLVISSG
ncbi:hypothetical protein HF673_17185 [Acidithiobacillus thiooxidans]|uniref:hypothetical protein n=1 Tax=Acidithiobacillus thiooxidans TaxID=930 RepID=UPI001C064CB6|nr:hypothetical protein [Acidithiobacillus thiooxidans]MBU2837428.1 hypothetical protein [Acidithiobacillus thiooxidans]